MQVWPGERYPLGATYDGMGTNFAIFSEVAERSSCACSTSDTGAERRVELPEVDAFVWHAYLPGIEPGQRYGFRVHGPYDPARGLRCNPHKLLLDPYAKAIDGDIDWDPALYGYDFGRPGPDVDDRLGAAHAEGGGGQPVLRLGQRPAAAHAVPPHGHLRGARARA